MTDWNALGWAIDVSHHNGAIDWGRIAAQTPACVFLKAAERRWTDPQFERNRQACIDRGLIWIPYIFLRPDDDEKTIAYALGAVGDAPVVALDWEEPEGPGTNPVSSAVVEAWIDALPRLPLLYYGMWPPAAATDKIARCPRWYPQYPGSATAAPRLPMWGGSADPDWRKCWLIWQWSAKGGLNGIGGNVDMNRLAVSAEKFAAWHATGDFGAKIPMPPVTTADPAGEPVGGMPNAVKAADKIEAIQMVLGVKTDGRFGPISRRAFDAVLKAAGQAGI